MATSTTVQSSTYLKEVARYLDGKPKSAADNLMAQIPQLAPGESQQKWAYKNKLRHHRIVRSSSVTDDYNTKHEGNVTVVSMWTPVPAGTATNSECESDEMKKRALVYRNGDHLCGIWMSYRSFRGLLHKATQKLRLPRPARRIFCEDGTEVVSADDIPHGMAIFASMGEEFRGATLTSFQLASGRVECAQRQVMSLEKRRQSTCNSRLNELVGAVPIRFLLLRNGDSLPDGDLSEAVVDVTKPGWLKLLFVQATTRLQMAAYARQAFNWNGRLLTESAELAKQAKSYDGRVTRALLEDQLATLPRLPQTVLAHITDGNAYGPIWISCGDAFRPEAVVDFAKRLLKRINKTLKLRKVGIDMTEEEYNEMVEYKPKLNEIIGDLRGMTPEEQPPRPPSASQLFECLRLKIFENGDAPTSPHFRQVTFPLSDVIRRLPSRRDDSGVLNSLLAYCGETARGKKIRRLFTADGTEVTLVRSLQSDDDSAAWLSVWCSGGESFIPYIQPMLGITLDQLRVYRIAAQIAENVLLGSDERQVRRIAVREAMAPPITEAVVNSKKRIGWQTVSEWPMKTDQLASEEITEALRLGELVARSGNLRASVVQVPKSKRIPIPLVIYAEMQAQIDRKTPQNKSDIAPLLQKWFVDEKGFIRPRLLPQLALAVDASGEEITCEVCLNNNERFAISGCRRLTLLPVTSAADRRWTFTSEGRIQSQGYSNLVLTFTGDSLLQGNNNNDGGNARRPLWAIAAPRQEGVSPPLVALQQWALRPTACWERRPKTSKQINPEWHARAFWWPTSDFSFAGQCISVNFAAMAPPITRTQDAGSLGVDKKRIFILPNGCDDLSRAVPIVVDMAPSLHCVASFDSFDSPQRDPTIRHFLSHATALLGLPSAARRIFNTNGVELTGFETVESDQLLYISCCEKFIDIIFNEEQRRTRYLRQMLSADTAKLQAYCALHSPNVSDMVVGFEGTAEPGTKLVILPISSEAGDVATLSARSGATSPTSTAGNGGGSTVIGEGVNKRRFFHAHFRLAEGGYLETVGTANKSLCLTVSAKESLTRDVSLELRRPDDPLQQWAVDRDGLIRCRYQTRYVVAVQLPDVLTNATSAFGSGVSPLVGSLVGVQQLRPAQFGRANQLFRFDRSSGRLFPFSANQRDLDITAASASGICTGAVCNEEIDQVGYELEHVEVPSAMPAVSRSAFKHLAICTPCARAVRGCGCQLKRITKVYDFRCAFSDHDKRQLFLAACGSRSMTIAASLGATVRTLYSHDLYSEESIAENMLERWEQQLYELTKSQQVEPNMAPSAAVVSAPLVWILARAVGTGIETGPPPVLVAGRSMSELLMQCTEKLALAFAARAMYARDGSRFVDTHAIADWIAENDEIVTARARILAAQRCPDLLRLMQPDEYGHVSPIESKFWARPLEAWVSDSKAFENPMAVDRRVTNLAMRFKDEHHDSFRYDTERSRLKGMEARRKELMTGQAFVSTEDPNGPVALEGGWKARAAEEVQLANKLQLTSRSTRSGADTARTAKSARSEQVPLGSDAIIRICAYENGGNPDSAVFVWGATVDELLRNATTRLNLRRPAKRLFALPSSSRSQESQAREIKPDQIKELYRDQVVAVSTGLNFISAESARSAIKVKAEWAQVRRENGPEATDMPVVAGDLTAQASTRAAMARSSAESFRVEEPVD